MVGFELDVDNVVGEWNMWFVNDVILVVMLVFYIGGIGWGY